MRSDDLHQMARMGLLAEAEGFFRETTDSRARKAANALDNKQRSELWHRSARCGRTQSVSGIGSGC